MITEEEKENCSGCELLNYKREQCDKLRKENQELSELYNKAVTRVNELKAENEEIKELKKIADANEIAIKELKAVLAHREKFIDWVMNKHPAIVSEYLL